MIATAGDLSGKRIFVTGGAGFIGSRLVRALVDLGAHVTVYDSLLEQVHGPAPRPDLPARLIIADVRDRAALMLAVEESNPQIVVHLAAETGTGQSADEPSRYAEVNVVGTAHLIEALRAQAEPPSRVVLAATRAVYGEGAYRTRDGSIVVPPPRDAAEMRQGRFEVYDDDNQPLEPVATPPDVAPSPGSIYGSTKLMQEYLLKQAPAPWSNVILRLQNVYGPGQSLRNPYTGVLSIFANQVMRGETINVYEDGEIIRDFVFVDDVVAAFVVACHEPAMLNGTFNIGTGNPTSILDAARWILEDLGAPASQCTISGAFRAGDIRYAVADIAKTLHETAWRPQVDSREGVRQLVAWARTEFQENL